MDEQVDTVYVANRVKDVSVPFVDSEKRPCALCGEEVWVDKNTRVHWMKCPIICISCLNELLEEDPGRPHTFNVPREVLESLKKFVDAQRNMMKK